MPLDIIRNAHRIHQQTLNRVAGEWVTYTDGEVVIRVQAVRGQSEPNEIASDGEYRISGRTIDWLILATDLHDAGVQIEPRPGATITPESSEGVYELTNGPSGECFAWSDARQVRLRIHTDRVIRTDA